MLGRKRKKGSFRLPVWLAGWMEFATNHLKLLQEGQSEAEVDYMVPVP